MIARFDSVDDWLDWQSGLSRKKIDLGLDRVARVAARLTAAPVSTRVITVGGTNGKGSCVRLLECMLAAAGYRVGAYTSPHLDRYNERIRLDGIEASDRTLCDAFARVDAARGDVPLTYFEFGTLAALDLFWRETLDVVVLEVGLGGRLDAVNVVDSDCAVVTNVGLDHLDWLGPDRESIGAEKAGIFRNGRPAICGDREPPASLSNHADDIGADLWLIDQDYGARVNSDGYWQFSAGNHDRPGLPAPALSGSFQFDNAATALAALDAVSDKLPVSDAAVAKGLLGARLPGRFERLPGKPATILDVAHNPDAARGLAMALEHSRGDGRTLLVLGMMTDKAVEEVAALLERQVDHWYLADLPEPRGLSAAMLRERVPATGAAVTLARTPGEAWLAAQAAAAPKDRIVACGSFVTVADVRRTWRGAQAASMAVEF